MKKAVTVTTSLRERKAKRGFHPTKEELIQTVLTLLQNHPLDQITSEQVLEASGVSRGSLYHHFEDFAELLELAQVRRFALYVNAFIERLTEIFERSETREQLISQCLLISREFQDPGRHDVRMERLTAISKVQQNPRMAKALGEEQERLTERIAELFHDLQLRGFGNPLLHPRTAAVLFQAYGLGRSIDDFTPNHMDPENWLYAITLVIENIFFPEQR